MTVDELGGQRAPIPTGPTWNKRPQVPLKPDGSKPVVALMFSGQARSLDRTIYSLERHLIMPLVLEGYEVHSFIVTEARWWGRWKVDLFNFTSSTPHFLIQEQEGRAPIICSKAMNKQLNQKQVRAYSGKDKYIFGYGAELLIQLIHRREGLQMVAEWEDANNRTFDWIVVARMDCIYAVDIMPLSNLPKGHIHAPLWDSFGGVNDRFAILPRGHAAYLYGLLFNALCARRAHYAKSIPYGWAVEHIYRDFLEVKQNLTILGLDDNFRFARLRTQYPYTRASDWGGSEVYWNVSCHLIDLAVRANCTRARPDKPAQDCLKNPPPPALQPSDQLTKCLAWFQTLPPWQEWTDLERRMSGHRHVITCASIGENRCPKIKQNKTLSYPMKFKQNKP